MSQHENGEEFAGRAAEMRESPWLASEDLDGFGDVPVVIERVIRRKNVEFEQGRKKPVVFSVKFVGKAKEMVLNGTNRKRLVAMFGQDVKEWLGKSIKLYVDPEVRLKREVVKGIRVRCDKPEVNQDAE